MQEGSASSGSEKEFMVDSGANCFLLRRGVPGAAVTQKTVEVKAAFTGGEATEAEVVSCVAALGDF